MDKLSYNSDNILKINTKIDALTTKIENGMSEEDKAACLQNIKYNSNEIGSSAATRENKETIEEIKNLLWIIIVKIEII